MVSKDPAPLDPMDFFPYRGQYGGPVSGALFFVGVRSTGLPLLFYSLLVSPASPLSLFSKVPWALPSPLPPAQGLSIAGLPDAALHGLSQTLGLSPYASVIFLGAALPSLSFTLYNLLWRRENFPMTGQGGSLQVTTQVTLLDAMHAILYVYLASRNPTWSATLFSWMPLVFAFGLSLHVIADHSKYMFRKDPKNQGKVYTGGVWGLVRHPNFLGFCIWRIAFATAAGGWAFGLALFGMFASLFTGTAVPIIEGYMAQKYEMEWVLAAKKVPYKMVPGVW